MSIKYRYVTKGHLHKSDKEGLYNLYQEEQSLINQSHPKLNVYGKTNKFKLVDIGQFDIPVNKNNYNFILAKDKKDNLLGYICFESISLNEDIDKLIIIKHMYISNASNHTMIDQTMFWILENISSKCAIYTDKIYHACNEFNGYSLIRDPFAAKYSKALKIKKKNRYPSFLNFNLQETLRNSNTKTFEEYANLDRI